MRYFIALVNDATEGPRLHVLLKDQGKDSTGADIIAALREQTAPSKKRHPSHTSYVLLIPEQGDEDNYLGYFEQAERRPMAVWDAEILTFFVLPLLQSGEALLLAEIEPHPSSPPFLAKREAINPIRDFAERLNA